MQYNDHFVFFPFERDDNKRHLGLHNITNPEFNGIDNIVSVLV
jgi:hypothetical protein